MRGILVEGDTFDTLFVVPEPRNKNDLYYINFGSFGRRELRARKRTMK